jgi:hypothetical protein
MKESVQSSSCLLKIIGIFEEAYSEELIAKLTKLGYEKEVHSSNTELALRNIFYPDFRDLMFTGKKNTSAHIYTCSESKSIDVIYKSNMLETEIPFSIVNRECFLFSNGLHFFSIEIEPKKNGLDELSDLIFAVRSFDSIISDSHQKMRWVNWIEENCLAGIKIMSEGDSIIRVDEYSGTKFKVFSIIEIDHDKYSISDDQRDALLYDFGSVAKIGTAKSDFRYSPSESYYKEMMTNKLSVFKNYSILPLFDTFTVIGQDILTDANSTSATLKRITWSQTYFRIYLYNYFLKYNLYKYNVEVGEDSAEVRDKFEFFLNNYNVKHISYNFLPTYIYQKHRKVLDIDTELTEFQSRINRISQSIQEEEQKRSSILLGIVAFFAFASNAIPVFTLIERLRKAMGMSLFSFYCLLFVFVTVLSLTIIFMFFPRSRKKILDYLR